MKHSENIVMKAIRIFFGIFMILLYMTMAVLMWINFFDFEGIWLKLRYPAAIILGLYGIYRCYRQVKNLDYYRLRDLEGDDE